MDKTRIITVPVDAREVTLSGGAVLGVGKNTADTSDDNAYVKIKFVGGEEACFSLSQEGVAALIPLLLWARTGVLPPAWDHRAVDAHELPLAE